jgi:hypothetical protein
MSTVRLRLSRRDSRREVEDECLEECLAELECLDEEECFDDECELELCFEERSCGTSRIFRMRPVVGSVVES